jgi:DNA-binding NarL/FixJ family response regulator
MTTTTAIDTKTIPARTPRTLQELADQPVRISPREGQIVEWITTGASNRQIAARMGLRTQTVKNHLCRIYRKLGVPNRVQLAVFALGQGADEPNS